MRIKLLALLVVLTAGYASLLSINKSCKMSNPKKSIYSIPVNSLQGEKLDLSAFKGKKLLIVNVASKCGFTPQYEELQTLSERYKDKLNIIGVPCNQFMNQEPGSSEEIASFCKKNYGVTFKMTEKVDVKGNDQHALYEWLTNKSMNGVMDSKVKWNFQKYLIDEEGTLVNVFAPNVKPLSKEITENI
jgi:glutathione peroxidase